MKKVVCMLLILLVCINNYCLASYREHVFYAYKINGEYKRLDIYISDVQDAEWDICFPFVGDIAKTLQFIEKDIDIQTVINRDGEQLLPAADLYLLEQYGNVVIALSVNINEERNYLYTNSKFVSTDNFKELTPPDNHTSPILALKAYDNGAYKYGYIDWEGNEVTPFLWYYAYPFSDGLALVYESEKEIGFIDECGEYVIHVDSNEFVPTGSFSDDRAPILHNNGKCGYINKNGNIIIPAIYEKAEKFEEGRAAVRDESGEYFIDTMGNPITEQRWDNVSWFCNGYAIVYNEEYKSGEYLRKYGFINLKGELTVPLQYASAYHANNDRSAWVTCSGKPNEYILISVDSGERLTDDYYDGNFYSLTDCKYGVYKVCKNGKYGVISTRGEVIHEPIYDNVYILQKNSIVATNNGIQYVITNLSKE